MSMFPESSPLAQLLYSKFQEKTEQEHKKKTQSKLHSLTSECERRRLRHLTRSHAMTIKNFF
jgi:hypothetical protein